MVSTRNSAGCPAASIARRTAAMSDVTPVEVSLCTTQTALIVCCVSSRKRASIMSACTPPPSLDAGQPQEFRLQPEVFGHLFPERREVASLEHQHGVAGAERVAERRFPCARARGRIDHDRLRGLEDGLDAVQDFQA